MIIRFIFSLGVSIGMAAGQAASLAQIPSAYSAKMTMTENGGTTEGLMRVSLEKKRVEAPEAIVIHRPDRRLSWTVLPEREAYIEQPMAAPRAAGVVGSLRQMLSKRPLGPGEIDGKKYPRFEVTYETANGKVVVHEWMGPKRLPVRVAAADGSWTVDYSDIEVGPQPPESFELPAGLRRITASEMLAGDDPFPVTPEAGAADGQTHEQEVQE